MGTSGETTNPQKNEDQSSVKKPEFFTPELFAELGVLLVFGKDNKQSTKVHLFSNPNFNGAVQEYLVEQHSAAEWNLLQEIYLVSTMPPEMHQREAERLLKKYFTDAVGEDKTNFSSGVVEKLTKGVAEKKGLDSFAPIMTDMTQLLGNILPRGNLRLPEITQRYKAAYEQDQKMSPHDKLMLPMRTVICNALENMKEIQVRSHKTPTTLVEKTKNRMRRFSRSHSLIEASEIKMLMIQKQLEDLLKATASSHNSPEFLQGRFDEIMQEAVALTKAQDELSKKLGSDHLQVRKVNAFLNTLSDATCENAKLNAKNFEALTALTTVKNTGLVQMYMAPIEYQIKERAEKKEAASVTRGSTSRSM